MIVVAGGTGFIGNAIAGELARRGERVVVLSHSPRAATAGAGEFRLELRRASVHDRAALVQALAGADAVVGAVQFAGFPNENPRKGLTFDAVDRQGTENLVAAATANGVRRYVYLSGAGAAPDADKPWFRAKWGAETAVRGSSMQYCILRPSWVYGPRDRALNRYVAFLRSLLPFVPVVGNGKQRLQPVFVEDVARVAAEALRQTDPLEGVFEIGGPEVLTMDEVIRTVQEIMGRRRPLLHNPVWLMKLLFSPKALLPGLPLPLSPTGVEFATMDALADNTTLLAALPNLRLTPLREGLSTYLEGSTGAGAA